MRVVRGLIELPQLLIVTARRAVRDRRAQYRYVLNSGLCGNETERAAHLANMRILLQDPELEKIHAWLHVNLNVLDAKAQAILGLYSIALATLTIFYAAVGTNAPLVIAAAIFGAFILLAFTLVPLARVSFVYWSTTEDFANPEAMLVDLLRVRDERSKIIRRSVIRGAYSLLVFGILLLWDIGRRL